MCGGTDRFHIAPSGASNSGKPFLIGCRHCGSGRETYEAHMRALGLWGEPEFRHYRQRPSPEPPVTTLSKNRTADMGRQAWQRSVDPEGTAAAYYLRHVRRVWPPDVPLPASVRWLPARHLSRNAPPDAQGAVLWAYTDVDGICQAVGLEALYGRGERFDGSARWRRTYGPKGRGLFRVPVSPGTCPAHGAEGEDPALHVAEGPVSALAARWLSGGPAVAVGGTRYQGIDLALHGHTGSLVLHVDGDEPGRRACVEAYHRLTREGRAVRIVPYDAGLDPADILTRQIRADDLVQSWTELRAQARDVILCNYAPTWANPERIRPQ